MKFSIFLFLGVSIFTNAQASWETAVRCDDATLVVDRSQGHEHQMVLRGRPLEFLVSQGAVPGYKVNNGEAVITVSRDLSRTDHSYFGSIYMAPGAPSTIAWYNLNPFNGGMILKYNQPKNGSYVEYKFYTCDFLLNP